MAFEVKVPDAGESITEVFIARWLKTEGDAVGQDEAVVEIESDKATLEVVSPVAGVLGPILKREGDSAAVGEVVATVVEGAAPKKSATAAPKGEAVPAADRPATGDRAGTAPVMPAAQRVLGEKGVAAADVRGSGPGGRVLKEDAVAHVAKGPAAVPSAAPSAPSPSSPPPSAPSPSPSPAGAGSREIEVVPMSPMRRRIAERLVAAQQNAALLTTFNEIDLTAVKALRADFQPLFQEKHGVKLGFMSFFVKAVIEGLKLIPQLNAEIRGSDIVYRNYYDIGIAVGGGKGLVVPVLRNAEYLSFAAIEKAIADFGARAQSGKIRLDELKDGTFTISNGGVYGSLLSTPIINPPQSGVLGLHAIQDRPVGIAGQIVLRPMMYVALTYDHRLVDGREAVTFLKHVASAIENPSRILLEV